MTLNKRIEALVALGNFLSHIVYKTNYKDSLSEKHFEYFNTVIQTEYKNNPWFTPESVIHAIEGIIQFLHEDAINNWITNYKITEKNKKIALILAGNIPLVGFQDVLCTLISGYKCLIKMSSKDNRLIKAIIEILLILQPGFKDNIIVTEEKLSDFDAVLATGSNNTSRYFEYYFGKYPHIFRRNRNSIAILDGNETNEQIEKLADDIFMYFGLGCRNVSQLLVPENYNFNFFFENIEHYNNLLEHNKYMNNHDYYRSIYLVNHMPHLDNGFLIVKEEISIASPIAVLYHHSYKNENDIISFVNEHKNQIQCIVANMTGLPFNTTKPGRAQYPELSDYADGIDTMDFLLSL